MSMMEGLENRRLMTANITSVTADNRGEVILNVSEDVVGVRKSSVRMYTFGPDAVANTPDDVRLNTVVRYEADRDRIVTRVVGNLPANVGYRIRIQARDVRSASDGTQLDGEYRGESTGISGNGVGNGNYNARFRQDTSDTPRVRMSTTAGLVDLVMRRDVAPGHVANFLRYADSGRYDGLFVNRSAPNFVVQLGAARVTGDGTRTSQIEAIERFPTIQNEFNLSNLRGTVALAKQGGDQNSGSADFFFNLADNTFLDQTDAQGGGRFTVFATFANSSGQATVDGIAAKPVVGLQNRVDNDPAGALQAGVSGAGLSDVPINSTTASGLNVVTTGYDFNGDGSVRTGPFVTGGLVPNRDLVIVRRTALLLKTASV